MRWFHQCHGYISCRLLRYHLQTGFALWLHAIAGIDWAKWCLLAIGLSLHWCKDWCLIGICCWRPLQVLRGRVGECVWLLPSWKLKTLKLLSSLTSSTTWLVLVLGLTKVLVADGVSSNSVTVNHFHASGCYSYASQVSFSLCSTTSQTKGACWWDGVRLLAWGKQVLAPALVT